MTGRCAGRRRERGSSSLEAAIVVPVLLILLMLVVAVARVSLAQQQLSTAAHGAARAAGLERDAVSGRTAGTAAAGAVVDLAAYGCRPTTKITGAWATPIGTPGVATATVTCDVALGDLLVPGLPGRVTLEATASSPIDRYRQRR